jgi:hypothetical protein
MEDSVSVVDAGAHRIARRALVRTPAAEVFALVANPHRHPEIDGSGTVRSVPVVGPEALSVGATFTVAMKQHGFPYKIKSKVTAFEPDKLVEWQHPAGHRWRWEFAEIEPGTTQVTETFDYSTAKAPRVLELFGVPKQNAAGITKTLEGLQARFA